MRWIDSHCHLQERFLPDEADGAHEAAAALGRAAEGGVRAVVCVGTDEATSRQAIGLARAAQAGELGAGLPALRAVIGLHPHDAKDGFGWLPELLEEAAASVSGIGECGLDYHYEHSERAAQQAAFSAQMALARASSLPLVIHARDAWEDLFAMLEAEGAPDETVLHCFTGGPAEAERCLELGLTISFSGVITFKNAQDVRDACAIVPLDRLIVETDAPFLAPVPHRGSTNEPALVPIVGEAVAAAKGLSAAEVAEATSRTAERIFGC